MTHKRSIDWKKNPEKPFFFLLVIKENKKISPKLIESHHKTFTNKYKHNITRILCGYARQELQANEILLLNFSFFPVFIWLFEVTTYRSFECSDMVVYNLYVVMKKLLKSQDKTLKRNKKPRRS